MGQRIGSGPLGSRQEVNDKVTEVQRENPDKRVVPKVEVVDGKPVYTVVIHD